MRVKVVVLGGSGVATPELAIALRDAAGRTQAIELVLVGRTGPKLETVAAAARRLAGEDDLLIISATTSPESALAGADYVLNQVRVGGYRARAFDESFSDDLGIPGEETVGPGGFANASRTIPVVLDYGRQIQKLCPGAAILSLANPSSLVQYALARYSGLSAVGLCDAPVSLTESIARALGVEPARLTIQYVGMHHFGFVTGVTVDNRDLLPEALAKAGEIVPEVDPELVRALGVIPGHYLSYVFHPDRMLARKRGRRTRAEELLELEDEIMAQYQKIAGGGPQAPVAGPGALERRRARWYRAIIVPVLVALIETGRGGSAAEHRFVLDLVNGATIPWLPAEAIVEVPAVIRQGRIVRLPVGPLPPDLMNLVQTNCLYEMLAVEAIVERDRAKALRALLGNPMVSTFDQAAQVLERAWSHG